MRYQIDVRRVRMIQTRLWQSLRKTFSFRKGIGQPLPVYGHYGGVFQVGNEELVIHTDGVGTKVLVAQALEQYDTIGIDAVAMSVNDILCLGAESLVGVDYIALAKEDDWLVRKLMKGLVTGAEQSNCAIVGGETAIMPDVIKGTKRPFDLTFTVVGRIVKNIILGDRIKAGDVLIGLESSGLHSNGYTLARKVLDMKKWGKKMLIPTRIYVKPILEIINAVDVHGIGHITGGAFSKLTRLNKNVGFVLTDMPKPKGIFKALEEKVGDTKELYKTFNMGIGMVLAVDKNDESTVHQLLRKHGVAAHTIGEVSDEPKLRGVWLYHNNKRIDLTVH